MLAMSNLTNDNPDLSRPVDEDAADLRRIAVTYVDEAFATGRDRSGLSLVRLDMASIQ